MPEAVSEHRDVRAHMRTGHRLAEHVRPLQMSPLVLDVVLLPRGRAPRFVLDPMHGAGRCGSISYRVLAVGDLTTVQVSWTSRQYMSRSSPAPPNQIEPDDVAGACRSGLEGVLVVKQDGVASAMQCWLLLARVDAARAA